LTAFVGAFLTMTAQNKEAGWMRSRILQTRWLEFSLLIAVVAVAAVFRFYKLTTWSFFIDELRTLDYTLKDSFSLTKPFWLITNASISSFGENALGLRLFPAIFGILTVALLYFPVKAVFGRWVALLSGLFLAVSTWHIYLSQFARWYSLLLLVSALSLLAFYLFMERYQYRYLILHLALFGFAFLLHRTAGFIPIISVSYLAALLLMPGWRPPRFNARKVGIGLIVLGGLGLMFLPAFFTFFDYWTEIKEQRGFWGNSPLNIAMKWAYHMTPSLVFMAAAGILLLLRGRDRKGVFLAIYCGLPSLLLLGMAAIETNVSARYAFFALPGVLIGASVLCVHLIRQVRTNQALIAVAILGVAILPSLQSDYLYYTSGHGHRDRLTEAVQFIKDRSAAGDRFFLLGLHSPEESTFYFQQVARLAGLQLEEEQFIRAEDPDKLDLDQRIWVVTRKHSVPAGSTGFHRWISENARILAEFRSDLGADDNSIRVYFYSPRDLKPEPLNVAGVESAEPIRLSLEGKNEKR
jgi:hypothetical protein